MSQELDLLDLLYARSGIVCAVGAGGKKSTLYQLLTAHPGRVALTATVFTTMFPDDQNLHIVIAAEGDLSEEAGLMADARRIAFASPSAKPGRVAGVSPATVQRLHAHLERDVTFVKADGARMRWIKAPNDTEPVIPEACGTVIPVVSVAAVGRPLTAKTAHRPERISAVTGLRPGAIIRAQHVARLLSSEAGLLRNTRGRRVAPVINMVDDDASIRTGREIAELALAESSRFDRVVLAAMNRAGAPVVAVIER